MSAQQSLNLRLRIKTQKCTQLRKINRIKILRPDSKHQVVASACNNVIRVSRRSKQISLDIAN